MPEQLGDEIQRDVAVARGEHRSGGSDQRRPGAIAVRGRESIVHVHVRHAALPRHGCDFGVLSTERTLRPRGIYTVACTATVASAADGNRQSAGRHHLEGILMPKRNSRAAPANRATTAPRPSAAADDDTDITALKLPPAPLSPEMAAYFRKCEEKLGFVPNVLKAYAFDDDEACGLRRHVQRSDAGAVGPEQARARDDRGRGVGVQSLLLLPGRPRRLRAPALRRSRSWRTHGDELSGGAPVAARARHARLRRQARGRAVAASRKRIATACAARASAIATSGTSAPWQASSTCRTAWRLPPTCGPTARITRRRGEPASQMVVAADYRACRNSRRRRAEARVSWRADESEQGEA